MKAAIVYDSGTHATIYYCCRIVDGNDGDDYIIRIYFGKHRENPFVGTVYLTTKRRGRLWGGEGRHGLIAESLGGMWHCLLHVSD